MEKLNDLHFEGFYRSNENIKDNVFVPAMSRAVRVDRAIGYFSSQGLWELRQGLRQLVINEGRMRIITSPNLSAEDTEAIANAYSDTTLTKQIFLNSLKVTIEKLSETNTGQESLAILGHMIKAGLVDIKVAHYRTGLYHEKKAIFRNGADVMVAVGSGNETRGGHVNNFESYSIDYSWKENADKSKIKKIVDSFEADWLNETEGLAVFDFPDAIAERIIKISDRFPQAVITKEGLSCPPNACSDSNDKFVPSAYPYQLSAVNEWVEANMKGIFKMATGTGKTFTGLFAATAAMHNCGQVVSSDSLSDLVRKNRDQKNFLLVVLAPYIHMLSDWQEECEKFGFEVLHSGMPEWKEDLSYLDPDSERPKALVMPYETFRMPQTQKRLKNLRFKHKMLLVDEVHRLGARECRSHHLDYFAFKLGLSATPERKYDPEGTQHIVEEVGKILEGASVTLKNAIDGLPNSRGFTTKYLCPYNYYIRTCEFLEEEHEEYNEIVRKIGLAVGNSKDQSDDQGGSLGALLGARNRLIGRAAGKVHLLRKDLTALKTELGPDFRHILIYCAEDAEQFNECKGILKDLGVPIAHILGTDSVESRAHALEEFASGTYPILLAKKCLNEGINVPQAKHAYILQSTTNEMEFVQRRGRVLRKYPGKEWANVTDYLVLPSSGSMSHSYDQKLIERELTRALEFAQDARNSAEGYVTIENLREKYFKNR